MANEITQSLTLSLNNAIVGLTASQVVSSKRINQTTARAASNVQTITTTAVAITIPADIATPGLAQFKNLDATNYVELGVMVSGTFYPLPKMKAGESQQWRISPSSTLYARANTASVLLSYLIFAD